MTPKKTMVTEFWGTCHRSLLFGLLVKLQA